MLYHPNLGRNLLATVLNSSLLFQIPCKLHTHDPCLLHRSSLLDNAPTVSKPSPSRASCKEPSQHNMTLGQDATATVTVIRENAAPKPSGCRRPSCFRSGWLHMSQGAVMRPVTSKQKESLSACEVEVSCSELTVDDDAMMQSLSHRGRVSRCLSIDNERFDGPDCLPGLKFDITTWHIVFCSHNLQFVSTYSANRTANLFPQAAIPESRTTYFHPDHPRCPLTGPSTRTTEHT